MTIAEYFSPDYASARERFCTAAKAARATLARYELPEHRGPAGEPLSIDVARLGSAEASAALVLISGTHGVEGFGGSGCQVGFLADRLHEALPTHACALLVHALNPFGFAWQRRVTEDGVDLNRNFIDFAQPPPSPQYDALHEALVPRDWQGEGRRAAEQALQRFLSEHGLRGLQSAVTGGQYTHPTGLFYGGTGPTWSARALMRILREQLPDTVRQLAVLDLHTGLGPHAYGEPIATVHTQTELERARKWYGCEVTSLTADESVSARLVGAIADGLRVEFASLERTFVALEFGTRPVLEVLTALRGDHWWHAYGREHTSLRPSIARAMRDAFYCETPAWQAAVYGRTADFVMRACRGLAEAR